MFCWSGIVTMWTPNMREPVAKMLCHPQPVQAVAVDSVGTYMATASVGSSLKIWDVRMLSGPLQDYKLRGAPSSLAFSQRGMLAVGAGNMVEFPESSRPRLVYRDCCKQATERPYLRHTMARPVGNLQFCAFEDVLGVATGTGFTSLLIPGCAEPNFDALENNPYQTKSQRRESEVKSLLGKFLKPAKINYEPRNKGKQKKGTAKVVKTKKILHEHSRREFVKSMKNIKNKLVDSVEEIPTNNKPVRVLDRFKPVGVLDRRKEYNKTVSSQTSLQGSADDILLLSWDSRVREGFIGIPGNNSDESTLDHVITDATVKRTCQGDTIQSGKSVLEYQNQAKMLFRKLTAQSPTRLTIETGPYLFHYLIENDVCYLVLAERNYSKRLAYSYLEDLAQEFHSQYGKRVNSVTRPYSFIEFDTYIQKAKKIFTDSRARRNLSALNTELQDVQRIMVQNIDDVLQRGVVLSELDTKAQNLSMLSQVYKKDATHLNTKSMYVKAAAGCFVVLVFVLYFWVL
uniref:(California timema) hypothetical protein n=1 Tax=Timema californicum TaxID=61474 RepID=A0A7R9JDY0_TIMCA|nr:unnamed protein product [Timema californicum]